MRSQHGRPGPGRCGRHGARGPRAGRRARVVGFGVVTSRLGLLCARLVLLASVLATAPVGVQAEDSAAARVGDAIARIEHWEGAPELVRRGERDRLELTADHRLNRYDYLRTASGERIEFVVPAVGEWFARVTLAEDTVLYLDHPEQGEQGEHGETKDGADFARPVVLRLLRGSLRLEVAAWTEEPSEIGAEPSAGDAAAIVVDAGALTVMVQDGEVGVETFSNGAVLVWADRGWARVSGRAGPDAPDATNNANNANNADGRDRADRAAGQQRLAGRGRMVEYRASHGLRNHLTGEVGGPEGRRAEAERDTAERVLELLSREEAAYLQARQAFDARYRELLELRRHWYTWMRAERVGRRPVVADESALTEIRDVLHELREPAETLERSMHRLEVLSRYTVQPAPHQDAAAGEPAPGLTELIGRVAARDRSIVTERLHVVRHLRAIVAEAD